MKKIFIGMAALAALFTVTLTSCSNDEMENVATASNAGEAIGFNGVIGNQVTTRATPTTLTEMNVANNTFMVWGYFASNVAANASKGIAANARYVGTSATVGTIIKYDGTNWVYNTLTDKAYWPAAALNFQAVTPYEYGTIVNDESGVAKLAMEVTIPADQTKQKDLMFGHEEGVTKASHNLDVQLAFEHALSQVVFKARTASTYVTANISGVEICNVKNAGTVGYTGAVTADKRKIAVDLDNTYDNYAIGMKAADVEVNSTTTAVQLNAANGTLMLLPQTGTMWTTTTTTPVTTNAADAAATPQSYLKLTCKIKNGSTYIVGSTSGYGTVYIPFRPDWAIGKKYTYTIIIGEGNNGFDENGVPLMQPISYVVQSIDDWGTVDRNVSL